MNIFLFIYPPIILYALKNYHRAFLLYSVMRIYLSFLVPFFAKPGLPILQMQTFMDTCFAGLAGVFFLIHKKLNFSGKKFPLLAAFILCIASIAIPCVLSSVSALSDSLPRVYVEVMATYIFAYLFWREIRHENDVRFVISGLAVVLAVAAAYGFFERFNGFQNPLIDYEISLNPNLRENYWSYGEDEKRGGLGRVRSVFSHAIGCGGTMAVAFCFFVWLKINRPKFWKQNAVFQFLLLGGFLMVCFFSNSRSPFVYLGIAMLFLLRLKMLKYILFFIPPFLYLSYDYISPYFNTILSLFSSNAYQEVGGSDLDLRISQLLTTFLIWMQHPLIGDGIKATEYWMEKMRYLLRGAESVWISILINRGLLGVVTHLFLCYKLSQLGIGRAKWYAVGSVLGWLAFTTATSTPGLSISFIMMLIIIAYKIEIFSKARIKNSSEAT